jgi:hypothetical protein
MISQPDAPLDPVVLRFEGMFPDDLKGYEAHGARKGGDLGHVDASRSTLNKRLIGKATWAADAFEEITRMKQENFVAELESLDRRNRRKDLERRAFEGPHNPWRATRHGPMREVILTANKTWFEGFDEIDSEIDFEGREKRFEKCAVSWLKDNFGDDVIHARADRDEAAYHIHAVIMPRVVVEIKGAKRHMLQPSIHLLIQDYEAAQNSVGEWFSQIGLRRGERRRQAFIDAVKAGNEPPEKRVHVRPVEWRRQEDIRLATERAAMEVETCRVAAREDEADVVIAIADSIADGLMTINCSGSTQHLRTSKKADAGKRATLVGRMRKSRTGRTRAATAFIAALSRMQARAAARAKIKAEEQARKDLARAFADIKAADDVIVGIAALLPSELRARVAKARRTLTAKIMSLGKTVSSDAHLKTTESDRSSEDPDTEI